MQGILDYLKNLISPQQQIHSPVPSNVQPAQSSSGPPAQYYQNPSAYPLTTAALQKSTASAPTQQTTAAPSGGGGSSTTQTDLARQALESRLKAINDRLALITAEADRQNKVAQGVRDEVVNNIDTTYGGLQTAADTNKTNALSALAENDRGVVRDYANTQGALNASTEGAITKNRALARALGYGNSSYYQDTQDKTRTAALDKTAGLQNEQASKLTAIKGKVADTNTWFKQKSTEIAQEAATLKSQADREYQQQVAQNQLLARTYGIDSVDAADQAQIEYQSKLDAISKYIGDKQNQIDTVAKTAAAQKSSITGYNPVAQIQPTLNTNTAITDASTPISSSIQSGGLPASTSGISRALADLNKKKNPYDQYLYA